MERCSKCGQVLRLSEEDVSLIKDALRAGIGVTEIAAEMGRPRQTIYRIKRELKAKPKPIRRNTYDLYRHFDAQGVLLYVGISLSALYRLAQHKNAEWYDQICQVKKEVLASKLEAKTAEYWAIVNEKPKHNKVISWFPEGCYRGIENEAATPEELKKQMRLIERRFDRMFKKGMEENIELRLGREVEICAKK